MDARTLREAIKRYLAALMDVERCRVRPADLSAAEGELHSARQHLRQHFQSASTPDARALADAAERYVAATDVGAGLEPNITTMSLAGRALRHHMRSVESREGDRTTGGTAVEFGLHQLLVPVDDSEQSRWALELAANLAKRFSSRISLVHVVEPSLSVEYANTYPGVYEAPYQSLDVLRSRRRYGEDLLRELRGMVPPGVPCETMLCEGYPASRIVEAAIAVDADLIVMGTHARGRLANFLLGSTASSVIRHAACPVLTIAHPVISGRPSTRSNAGPVTADSDSPGIAGREPAVSRTTSQPTSA